MTNITSINRTPYTPPREYGAGPPPREYEIPDDPHDTVEAPFWENVPQRIVVKVEGPAPVPSSVGITLIAVVVQAIMGILAGIALAGMLWN